MDLTVLIPALLFALVAASILGLVIKVVLQAAIGDPRAWSERWKLRRKMRWAEEADSFIEQELFPNALPLLKQSFFLDPIRFQHEMVKLSHNHNLAVLGRLVVIAEKLSAPTSNLALIEGLLQSRNEILESYFETALLRAKIRSERAEEGKETPEWSENEFAKKLNSASDKIITNRKTLISQIDELTTALAEAKSQSSITYH